MSVIWLFQMNPRIREYLQYDYLQRNVATPQAQTNLRALLIRNANICAIIHQHQKWEMSVFVHHDAEHIDIKDMRLISHITTYAQRRSTQPRTSKSRWTFTDDTLNQKSKKDGETTHRSQTVPGPFGPGPHFSTHFPSLYRPVSPHWRHVL